MGLSFPIENIRVPFRTLQLNLLSMAEVTEITGELGLVPAKFLATTTQSYCVSGRNPTTITTPALKNIPATVRKAEELQETVYSWISPLRSRIGTSSNSKLIWRDPFVRTLKRDGGAVGPVTRLGKRLECQWWVCNISSYSLEESDFQLHLNDGIPPKTMGI